MKTKKFNKKLVLKSQTIANLNQEQMKQLPGGARITWFCPVTQNDLTSCCTEMACEL
jgi:natural product precursor